MSYSFSVKAATKAEVITLVREQLDSIVLGQPVHANDYVQAMDCVKAFVGLLPDDDTKDYGASVSGWLSWNLVDGKESFTGANVNVSVGIQPRKTA